MTVIKIHSEGIVPKADKCNINLLLIVLFEWNNKFIKLLQKFILLDICVRPVLSKYQSYLF